jgi:hypothetical protein
LLTVAERVARHPATAALLSPSAKARMHELEKLDVPAAPIITGLDPLRSWVVAGKTDRRLAFRAQIPRSSYGNLRSWILVARVNQDGG